MKTKIIKVLLAGITLAVISVGLLAWSPIAKPINKKLQLTVFVHGSIYVGLGLLNSSRVLNDNLTDNCLYVSLIEHIRRNPLLENDQLLLQEGWASLNKSHFDAFYMQNGKCFQSNDRKRAAYSLAPTYDVCCNAVQKGCDKKYALFGHLGLLSQKYRFKKAEELYATLCNEIETYRRQYSQIEVHIVSHSHGGNIALNLARVEDARKRGLVVNDLVMYGTPVHIETAPLAYRSDVFKRVINFHSDGDTIQGAARFSTSAYKSWKLFSDPTLKIKRNPKGNVHDVRLTFNGERYRIDHINMWQMSRSQKIFTQGKMGRLPMMVITPALRDAVSKSQNSDASVQCDVVESSGSLHVRLRAKDKQVYETVNIYTPMVEAAEQLKKVWMPESTVRRVMFNRKVLMATYEAFKDVYGWSKKKVDQVVHLDA